MRILALTPFVPNPRADHGGAVYLGVLLAELADLADLTVLSLRSSHEPVGNPLAAGDLIAVRHDQARDRPGPTRVAHRMRMLWRWTAGGEPLWIAKHASVDFRRTLRRQLHATRPDVVLVEMSVMAQYLPELAGVPTILTDHERGEPPPVAPPFGAFGRRRDRQLWRTYVRNHYPRADLVQALSGDDARHLEQLLQRAVAVRPPAVAVPKLTVKPSLPPPRALFVGNYLHAPNPESAARLAREVWPLVRQRRPDAELWIVGPHAGPALHDLSSLPGVRLIGAVDDLATVFDQGRLLLAPLFSGGGVRIKVLTAMAHGLPVVSNELGLRGVTPTPEGVRLAESPAALATAVVDWLDDPAGAAASGQAARRWVTKFASPRAVAAIQLEQCRALLAQTPAGM